VAAGSDRIRVWLLILLGVAVLAAAAVFKVRVAVAGLKYIVAVAVILGLAWFAARALRS
jgi:hypothetical protein